MKKLALYVPEMFCLVIPIGIAAITSAPLPIIVSLFAAEIGYGVIVGMRKAYRR